MKFITRWIFLLFFALFALTGCYNKSVQHLASDAALIKAGSSTRHDVLMLLGEPDAQQEIAVGVQEWVYYEEDRSLMQRTPLVGELFDPNGYGVIRILMKGDLVTACRYNAFTDGEFDWNDDFSWQEEGAGE